MGCCCFKSGDWRYFDPKEEHSISEKISKEDKPLGKFVALDDYKAGSKSELNLTKGEMIEEVRDVDDVGPEWVLAMQPGKGTGYAPRVCLAEVGTYDAKPWYFGDMRRKEADKILRPLSAGTFLIRSTATRAGKIYTLSKNIGEDEETHQNEVMHFRLHTEDSRSSMLASPKSLTKIPSKKAKSSKGPRFVLNKNSFDSIDQLIEFYKAPWKEDSGSVAFGLTKPPPKPKPERIELPVDVQKNWQEIPRQQIQIVGKELGKGNFGIVRKGIWKPTAAIQLEVAIKELKKGSTNQREDFLREAVAMKNLIHKHLVKLHGIVSANEPYWIVTEFVKDGSLKDFLQKRKKAEKQLVEPKLVEISTQIADGMKYLESKRVVHRDLAARNVLVDERKAKTIKATQIVPKIADFGMARMIKSGVFKESSTIDLAIKWMAPEVLAELRFSTKSDVWSYGIVLHEIFTHGDDPYEGMRTKDLKRNLLKKKFCLQKDHHVPERIFDLIRGCCEFDEKVRPRFSDIFEGLEKYYDGMDPYCKLPVTDED